MNKYQLEESILINVINYIKTVPTGNNTFAYSENLIKTLANAEKVEPPVKQTSTKKGK